MTPDSRRKIVSQNWHGLWTILIVSETRSLIEMEDDPMTLTPQTYPFTYYYLRVPGEHEGTWVPVRVGMSAVTTTWGDRKEALDYAAAVGFPRFKLIQVTEEVSCM